MSQENKYPIKEVKLDVWNKKVSCTSMFTIPAEDEALPVLKELDQMMTRLLTLPLEETIDEECVEFFFVHVFPVVCQKIIRSRYFKSPLVLRLANSILQNSIYLVHKYLQIGIKYPKFLEVLPTVFCTDEYYFKSNDQLSYYHYPYSYFPIKHNLGDTLKINDLIDILKIDSLFDKVTWSQGKVVQIFQNDLEVAYLYDWENKTVKIRKDCPQIAQYNSRSKENMDWRLNLKEGDLVDCEQMYGNWYNATITKVIQEAQFKKVQVKFRVYNPKGNRTDEIKGENYFGSILQEQLEIDCTSPRIAPYCTVAKEFSYETGKLAYDVVDDINDYEFQEFNGSRIYAIPRKKYLSSLLFNTINGFGQAGGFDTIINYLEKQINYDVFCYFAKGVSGIVPFLHRKFIHDIIGRLRILVEKYIFGDSQKMSKQFTKQKSEMIFSGLRALQKRVYSTDTVYRFENGIKMNLVESCLDNKLTQKLQGLHELKDIVKNGVYITQKNRQIKNWIKQNKIFEKIYITNSHAQLIKKSEDFFKYLITQSILEVTDLERLYKIAQKSDFETRISLYKLFQEVAYIFKKHHVEFLIDTILESEYSLIRNEDIDLLHELSRFSNYFPLDKVITFFESIILSSNNKISEVNDYAIKKYSDIVVRNHEMKSRRRGIIKNFLTKMATHDISQITKVLKGIFEGIGIGEWGKKDLYEILADQKIDEVAIEALKKNKSDAQFPHIFKEVLSFLLSIYKLSMKIKILVSTLTRIWEIIEDNEENEKTFYKWTNQLFDKCEQGLESQSLQEFQDFYRKLFTTNRIQKMQGLEFELGKNLFTDINKKSKVLSVTNCLRNNTQQKQYKRKVEMRQLKLVDLFIQMVFEIKDTEVSQKALIFFVELYNSKENSQTQINEFLNELLSDFKKYYQDKHYKMINKVIKLIEVIINDSEKNCDAGIESLLRKKKKKDQAKFIVINQIYYSSDSVKKIDVFLEMNSTVMDLRKKLAKQFDATWQQIRITSTREIPDHQNSKTLQQIQLNPNIPLTITKRIIYSESEGELTIGDQLNPKAIRCFKKIFEKYSTDQFMNKDQCNSFTAMCLGSTSSKKHYSQKIQSLYNKYDDDQDGFLTFANFLTFYKDAADDRPMTVWSNLRSFGVRGNFRFRDQPEEENGGVTKFPRVVLAEKKQFYKMLFQLLNIKQSALLSYQLLQRLPVYIEIQQKILSIENKQDVKNILNCSGQYELFYKLSIIQYLVNSEQLKKERQQKFHLAFIGSNGYEQLYDLAKKSSIVTMNIQNTISQPSDKETIFSEENSIDINQSILYTTLTLLKNFWTDYQRKGQSENIEKSKLAESMALLHVDYDIDQKIQYLVTGLFPKKEQSLEIRNKALGNKINLKDYEWNGQLFEQICKQMLNILQKLWESFKKSSYVVNNYNNPIIKQKATISQYLLQLLISETLSILNTLFLNKTNLAINLVKKILELIDSYVPSSSSRLLPDFYCVILCQCFFSETYENNNEGQVAINIQSVYIKQLFKNLTKGNITSEHFRVLAVLVSKFGIGGQQKQSDEQVQKMKNILFDNVITNNNQLTIQGCAQLLCNFKLTNTSYQNFNRIWDECLFNPGTLCTKEQTKSTLYKLILKICSYNPELLNKIIQKVWKTIQEKSTKLKITYCNQFKQRSITGFSGLKNLGNICYMNSMLQQIYMNKIFRYLILRINDYKNHSQTEIFDQKEEIMRIVDDNLLHQTQRIFAHLDNSTRIDYIPKDFCVSYKPFGESINIMIQQDVQEFVSMFFDRLESFIADTPFKSIVQDFYSGKTANIFKCHNCKKAKKVEENFHCLALQVKNAKNLTESFVRFITGEQISDFRCDFCEQKVDVNKKTVVSKAPRILLIHLQRIIFNLDTFVNEKLSTKHSFPLTFNIYPYTLLNYEQEETNQNLQKQKKSSQQLSSQQEKSEHEQSQDNSYSEMQYKQSKGMDGVINQEINKKKKKKEEQKQQFEYELAGIVCHSGHAEAGHYISYIKTEENKWLEFNDSIVTYFNQNNIQSECFGGTFASSSAYDDDYDMDMKRETSKCAYMVIYQKKYDKQEKRLINLIMDEKFQTDNKITKSQFLTQYHLQEVISKLAQQNQSKNITKKGKKGPSLPKEERQRGDQSNSNTDKQISSQDFQTGDNLTNQKNANQSQQQSSEVHEDSERETKQLLAAKQIQIRRHQSQDDIQVDDIKVEEPQNSEQMKNIKKQDIIIAIDPANISPYLPAILKEEVQNDNIIHFYQRCFSSSNFSSFFAQLLSQPHNLQHQLLPLCQKLTFGFWLKSPSFKQLLQMLDYMIKGDPQGFSTVITQNKAVINLLIECPDNDVRTNMATFLSKSIADVIQSQPDFNVKNQDDPIIKFLDHLLSLLPSTVTKCWTKFSQYFQFWYQLSQKCKVMVQYMINREIIKHFMDYFLDTKSPLKIYCNKKQNSIGSSYASPNFSFLLKCVSSLLQQKLTKDNLYNLSKKQMKLTPDEQLLLVSCESLQKLLSDNYENIASQLVKQICPNNLYASERVAFVILKGISKSSYQTIQPYLEVLHEFIIIQDQYQDRRMKWVLGKQTLAVSTYAKKIIAINSYTLDQRIYNFDSALYTETGGSLLDYLFVYYRKMENFSMLCLKQILKLCAVCPKVRVYIFQLDSPTLAMKKYADFFKEFINRVCGYYGYYSAAFNKEQLGKQLKILHEKVLKLVEQDNLLSEDIENEITQNQKDTNKVTEQYQKAQQTKKEENNNNKQYQQHIIESDNEDNLVKKNMKKQANNDQNEESIHNLIDKQTDQLPKQKDIDMHEIEIKDMVHSQEDDHNNQEGNYSFKDQGNRSNNDLEEEEQSYNSWEDLPVLEKAKSIEQEGNKQGINNKQCEDFDPTNKYQTLKSKKYKKKNDYKINVVSAERDHTRIYDEITSMEFSSEEDEPLISKQTSHKGSKDQYKPTIVQTKDYQETYHPIIFEYIPVSEYTPTDYISSSDQSSNTLNKDIKIHYHESLVTYGMTKPTGNSNRSVQMGMNGQKVVDRFNPEVMQNTRTKILSGFFVRNDTRQFVRIQTDEGCSYCKGLESVWVWAKQIKKAWISERCIDLPKWSLYEAQRKNKNQQRQTQ